MGKAIYNDGDRGNKMKMEPCLNMTKSNLLTKVQCKLGFHQHWVGILCLPVKAKTQDKNKYWQCDACGELKALSPEELLIEYGTVKLDADGRMIIPDKLLCGDLTVKRVQNLGGLEVYVKGKRKKTISFNEKDMVALRDWISLVYGNGY